MRDSGKKGLPEIVSLIGLLNREMGAMAGILRVSSDVSISFNAMRLLSNGPRQGFSARRMAGLLDTTPERVSELMIKLEEAGIVERTGDGEAFYRLSRPAEGIRLIDIFEAIEGPVELDHCPLSREICRHGSCPFNGLLQVVNGLVRDYFAKTKVSDLIGLEERVSTP